MSSSLIVTLKVPKLKSLLAPDDKTLPIKSEIVTSPLPSRTSTPDPFSKSGSKSKKRKIGPSSNQVAPSQVPSSQLPSSPFPEPSLDDINIGSPGPQSHGPGTPVHSGGLGTGTPLSRPSGPKASLSAINAGLRALDRSGSKCRKWTLVPVEIKSFTGFKYELKAWNGGPKPADSDNSDVALDKKEKEAKRNPSKLSLTVGNENTPEASEVDLIKNETKDVVITDKSDERNEEIDVEKQEGQENKQEDAELKDDTK